MECTYTIQARSQPVLSGKPEGPFCLSCFFIFRNERNWMKKSARLSERLVSPGLPGLQVATRLPYIMYSKFQRFICFIFDFMMFFVVLEQNFTHPKL